jgi:hypothetical protein
MMVMLQAGCSAAREWPGGAPICLLRIESIRLGLP